MVRKKLAILPRYLLEKMQMFEEKQQEQVLDLHVKKITMIKIKLKDIRNEFYEASGSLSTINRQIAFAGIGVVWIFVKTIDEKLFIDSTLLYAVLFFVIALLLDMLQYLYKSIFLELFRRYHEKKFEKIGYEKNDVLEEYVKLSNKWNYPTWAFFIFKVIFVGIGYFKLLLFILNNMQ